MTTTMRTDVVVIGCSKDKQRIPRPARELYVGTLFVLMRDAVEATGHPYLILSGRHGLVNPDHVLVPYDTKISDWTGRASPDAITPTALRAQGKLTTGTSVVSLAPHAYTQLLRRAYPDVTIHEPLSGYGVGERFRVARAIRDRRTLSAVTDPSLRPARCYAEP